jgi:4-carboxymuconolactone decarboxylase
MSRLPPLERARLDEATAAVFDAIASGPRGRVSPPYQALLRSPALAGRIQSLGAFLRFESAFPDHLREFAILITARAWNCAYEWHAHYPIAIAAGLAEAIAQAVAEGRRPDFADAEAELVYDFSTELQETRRVNDALYGRALARFDEAGVVELTAINGYYAMFAMILNTFEIGLPEGVADPFSGPQITS